MNIVEIEPYGKKNCQPPWSERYRIRIDKKLYVVEQQEITRRELLELAEKRPPEAYKVFQKIHGGTVVEVCEGASVDLRRKGIERFMTVPLEEQEG